MWKRIKNLDWHKKIHWLALYGLLCIAEFVISHFKEMVEKKFKPPKPPKDPDDGDDDDDDEDEDEDEDERKKKKRSSWLRRP